MKTQIIYDNEGYIISIRQGEPAPRNPIGVPFLNIEIPSGKQIKIIEGVGVDVTKTPHEVMLEDVPPSEIDLIKEENSVIKQENLVIKQSVAELAELILGGM